MELEIVLKSLYFGRNDSNVQFLALLDDIKGRPKERRLTCGGASQIPSLLNIWNDVGSFRSRILHTTTGSSICHSAWMGACRPKQQQIMSRHKEEYKWRRTCGEYYHIVASYILQRFIIHFFSCADCGWNVMCRKTKVTRTYIHQSTDQ